MTLFEMFLRIKKMSGEVVLAARVYRDLLKAVVKHVGKEDHKAHFTYFVKQEFRRNANSDPTREKINLARNYTYLINSIHAHKVKSFMILSDIGILLWKQDYTFAHHICSMMKSNMQPFFAQT